MSNRRRPSREADLNRQLSQWSARRTISWTLLGLAVVVAAQHLLAHAGWRPLPMGMGRQDIFFGYPMAALLGFGGLLALDPRPRL